MADAIYNLLVIKQREAHGIRLDLNQHLLTLVSFGYICTPFNNDTIYLKEDYHTCIFRLMELKNTKCLKINLHANHKLPLVQQLSPCGYNSKKLPIFTKIVTFCTKMSPSWDRNCTFTLFSISAVQQKEIDKFDKSYSKTRQYKL